MTQRFDKETKVETVAEIKAALKGQRAVKLHLKSFAETVTLTVQNDGQLLKMVSLRLTYGDGHYPVLVRGGDTEPLTIRLA